MNKRDLRNSEIELIYFYVEEIIDEFGQDIYTNISLNLSSNMLVAYDYEKGILKIEKKKSIPDNFWSLEQNEDTNIINNVLILGENGTGKTTLLELIYAGNLENIEKKLGNYMFLYSIKDSESYYIKSNGLKWIEQIDFETCNSIKLTKGKTPVKDSEEFFSYYCKITDTRYPIVYGYYGLITVDDTGKINIDKNVIEIVTLPQKKEYWSRIPMNGIYLSTAITESEETGRFVSRKRIHHENTVTSSEIAEFILKDMQRRDGIIKSNPYMSFSNITVKNLTRNREVFKDDFLNLCGTLNMKYREISETEKKYQFFALVWISFMLRLYENQLLDKNFMKCLEEVTTYKAIYENSKKLFLKLFIYKSNQLNETYYKFLQAVEDLDEEIFEYSKFRRVPFGVSWNVSMATIAKRDDWSNQIVNFIHAKDEFERSIQLQIQKKCTWDYIPNFIMNHHISDMSSGETILISNVFSKISKNMIVALNRNNEPRSVLLIMDEPECTFHIRWTQRFTKYLIEFLNAYYPSFSFQIIMTSHMPFLATDYPRGNIICIPGEDWKKEHHKHDQNWLDGRRLLDDREMYNSLQAFTPNYGFMSNYYDVVRDNFFVDVPIGMFAQNKFDNLKKKVDLITGSTSEHELKNIAMEIELIDEPVLKKYVHDAFQEKLDKLVGRNELEQEAALLKKRLDEINRRLKDMRE